MKKRIWSVLLTVCMVLSMLPFGASAASGCTHQATDLDTSSTVSTITEIYVTPAEGEKGPTVSAQVCWQCGAVISCTVTPFKTGREICREHRSPVTVVVQEPACEQAGLKITYCANCGSLIHGIQPQGIPGTEHTLQFHAVQQPACGVDGWGYAQCTVCGKPFMAESLEKALSLASESQQTEVKQLYQALKHNYQYVLTPVDLTGDGQIDWRYAYGIHDLFPRIVPSHYQTVNGEKIVNADGTPVELFAVGTDSYGAGYTGDKVCNFCGEVVFGSAQESLNDAHADSYAVIQTGYLPYIDTDGKHIDGVTDTCYCQHCGKTIGGSVIPFNACPPADNTPPDTMVVNIIKPTCTESGYSGDTYKYSLVKVGEDAEHEAWVLIQQGVEIPALGHDYQPLPDAPATCTSPGVSYVNGVVCSRCGETVYDRQINYPATGHHWHEETLVYANCKNRGLDVLRCSECGALSEMFYTRPGQHIGHTVNHVEPTCTEPGYSGDFQCNHCGEIIYPGFELEPLGHDWTDWLMEKDPIEMVEFRVCNRCFLREEREIEPNAITILTQPEDVVCFVRDIYFLSVEAEGDGLSYRWQFSDDGGNTWKRSAVGDSQYIGRMSENRNGRLLRCIVSDRYGNSVVSKPARLSLTDLAITRQPEDYLGDLNSTARITVEAQGQGLQYRWEISYDGENWDPSSVTSNRYSVKLTEARDGRMVRCIVTDQYGNCLTSDAAVMRIRHPLTITSQPQDYVGALGSTASFFVEAEGDGLTYQWQFSDNGGSKWSKSSVKTSTYAATLTAAKDGRLVRCVVTDQYGSTVISDAAAMRVFSGPVILQQPEDYVGALGSTASFSVEAEGDGLTYQWQFSDNGGSKWSKSSVTSAEYNAKLTSAKDGRLVRCIVTDQNGNSVTSGSASMKIG